MNYNIISIPPFDRQLKRLIKKYPSLKKEYSILLDNLERNPVQGVSIGDNCFKIRVAIESKGKGKSGGARVVTNIAVTDEIVYLLSIYDKSEKENLTDKELTDLFKYI